MDNYNQKNLNKSFGLNFIRIFSSYDQKKFMYISELLEGKREMAQ